MTVNRTLIDGAEGFKLNKAMETLPRQHLFDFSAELVFIRAREKARAPTALALRESPINPIISSPRS